LPKLKIIKYEHPLLREKARDIKRLGSRERDLIAAMGETMYAARGVGLAAPQVGVLERLFVLDVDQDREEENGVKLPGTLQVFMNPEIIWESADDEPFNEGCLSIPGIEADVYRPSRIRIVARNEKFEPVEIDAEGLLARVFQHEHDHLNGVLFVDRLPLIKRRLLARDLNRLRKESLEEVPAGHDKFPIEV
jgi:peptide deformylase